VIKWVHFLEGLPLKFGRAKTSTSARFLTIFNFDREYPAEGIDVSKIGKQLINNNPSHVGRKKVGELWSTNKKVIGAHVDPF